MEWENKEHIYPEGNQGIGAVYEKLMSQQPELKEIPEESAKNFISQLTGEINLLEELGERSKRTIDLSDEEGKKIAALWVFSGSGAYDGRIPQEGSYVKYPWTWSLDRERLNYAARIIRRIAEISSGESVGKTTLGNIKKQKEETRSKISDHGPYLIYNGTDIQNAVARDFLEKGESIIPEERVKILGNGLKNTLDQIKTFHLPEGINIKGKEIAIISHAPHLARVLHMMKRYQSLPPEVKLRAFPLPTPKDIKEEYEEMEIRGLLYYTYLSKDHDSSETPFPYLTGDPAIDNPHGKRLHS